MARAKKVTQRSFSCTDDQLSHLQTFGLRYGLTVSQVIQKFADYLWSGRSPESHSNQIAKLLELKAVSDEEYDAKTKALLNRAKGAYKTKKLRLYPGQTDLFEDKED